MSAGSPLKHLAKQSVQEDIPQSDSHAGMLMPPRTWRGSSEEKNTSPKETVSSDMEHKSLQLDCVSLNNAPNLSSLRDTWENPQPPERAFSPQPAKKASDWLPPQQIYGEESVNPPKPMACDQSERAHGHQTAASFPESSEGTLPDGADLLTQKMDAFVPFHEPKMAVTNPNASFKAACDSIANLRTCFDHFIRDKMEALGSLAPDLLWMDTRSFPGALEAMETVQATAASCDYIVNFLNWSPSRLRMARGQGRLRLSGAGLFRGFRPYRPRKGKLSKSGKLSQRAIRKFLSENLGKSGPPKKRLCLKASKSKRKA